MSSFIRFHDVAVRFRAQRLFEALSLSLQLRHDGRTRAVALVGPSGSGKSTLLDLVIGMRFPDAGRVDVSADLRLGYVPQSPVFFDALSVGENARLLQSRGRRSNASEAGRFAELTAILTATDLLDGRPLSALSGGERQRVMLLRALSVSPTLLLCDEATAGLDAALIAEFMSHLHKVKRELDTAILFVAHTWREIAYLADEILYFKVSPGSAVVPVVLSPESFAAKPPTVHAFLTIHWPHCSFYTAERVSHGHFAPIAPAPSATPAPGKHVIAVPGVAGDETLTRSTSASGIALTPASGVVYDAAGQFVTHYFSPHTSRNIRP